VDKNHGKQEQLTKVQQGYGGAIASLQQDNDALREEVAKHQAGSSDVATRLLFLRDVLHTAQ
jgi:hypothetical protein